MAETDTSFFDIRYKYCGSSEQNSSTCVEVETYTHSEYKWPSMKRLVAKIPKLTTDILPENQKIVPGECRRITSLEHAQLESHIKESIRKASSTLTQDRGISPFQLELLSIIREYRDLYFTERTFENAEEIRLAYCMHVMDHILKSRSIITNNNALIASKFDIPDNMRDQGLVRPKVLILAPFKDAGFK